MSDSSYKLPDFAPAPTSDLQLLLRRLLEQTDWCVLPAVLDELKELGRECDAEWLQGRVARIVVPFYPDWGFESTLSGFCRDCTSHFWLDLFDWNDTLNKAIEKCKPKEPSPLIRTSLHNVWADSYSLNYVADEDIPAGSAVVATGNGRIRRAPAEVATETLLEPAEHANEFFTDFHDGATR